ncbi:uncharacterized protein BKA78DRAFT_63472 [Phyllosticta capitalensis]|uniref:uncharacterized protein n=1 Tax=Phyllosticta capitalensis TaxID=121624 RepID=UPI00312CDFFA
MTACRHAQKVPWISFSFGLTVCDSLLAFGRAGIGPVVVAQETITQEYHERHSTVVRLDLVPSTPVLHRNPSVRHVPDLIHLMPPLSLCLPLFAFQGVQPGLFGLSTSASLAVFLPPSASDSHLLAWRRTCLVVTRALTRTLCCWRRCRIVFQKGRPSYTTKRAGVRESGQVFCDITHRWATRAQRKREIRNFLQPGRRHHDFNCTGQQHHFHRMD